MKIFIRLTADLLIEYTCRGARNGLARVQTHESRIQNLALKHFQMSPAVFSVVVCSEERQKDEAGEKSTYYMEGSVLCAYMVPLLDEDEEE